GCACVERRCPLESPQSFGGERRETLTHPGSRLVCCGGEQVVVAVEVVPHRTDVQTGLIGDLPQRHALDTFGHNEAERRLDDLLTPLLRVDPCGPGSYFLSLTTRASSHTGSLLSSMSPSGATMSKR